jgi:exonuclease-1
MKEHTSVVREVIRRVKIFLHHEIIPLLVFDGMKQPAKYVNATREASRLKNRLVVEQMMEVGDEIQIDDRALKAAASVTSELVRDMIVALRVHGFANYVVAPYEADAQLARLARDGVVYAVATSDSDLIVHGVERVLTRVTRSGWCDLYDLAAIRRRADQIVRGVPSPSRGGDGDDAHGGGDGDDRGARDPDDGGDTLSPVTAAARIADIRARAAARAADIRAAAAEESSSSSDDEEEEEEEEEEGGGEGGLPRRI